ncbi:hypothetical protein L2A60_18750 [Acidiphilium iwatense]|uniref:Uncharacterized protein n=2 Tax=Acidiphilium iwatense TaxID=768198 RepID=A0ABS9E1A7_9PROT|nr:hypothetical protein [Acidiphilium iwatense]
MAPVTVLLSPDPDRVSARECAFAAQYPAHVSPHQRFTPDLAVGGAWHEAGVAGYAFTVWNFHPLLLAGFDRRTGIHTFHKMYKNQWIVTDIPMRSRYVFSLMNTSDPEF